MPSTSGSSSRVRAAIESLESRRLLTQTVAYTYTGPDFTTAPGVTANWYSTPENSVGGNTLKGLNGNTSRPLVLNGLPSHSTISIAFDLVTTGTFSGGNFSVVQRTVGPGPSYTVTNTTRLTESVSHTGTDVTYTRYRIEFAQSDNRLDLQFNMSGVPSQFGTWGIDNVSVVNDRETPSVSISATTPRTTEGSSEGAVYTITRTTADEPLDVTVQFPQYVQGTAGLAALDADFTLSPDHTGGDVVVSFAANETSKTITLHAVPDVSVEDDETVTAQLVDPGSESEEYTVGGSGNATVTLSDLPAVSLELIQDGSEDSNKAATFRITRTGATSDSLDIFFMLGGTAVGGTSDSGGSMISSTADYLLPAGTTGTTGVFVVTIPGGDSSAEVTLPTFNDDADEAAETIIMTLQGPTSGFPTYGIAQATQTATVKDIRLTLVPTPVSGNPPTEAQVTAEIQKLNNVDPAIRQAARDQLRDWRQDFFDAVNPILVAANEATQPLQTAVTLGALIAEPVVTSVSVTVNKRVVVNMSGAGDVSLKIELEENGADENVEVDETTSPLPEGSSSFPEIKIVPKKVTSAGDVTLRLTVTVTLPDGATNIMTRRVKIQVHEVASGGA